MHDRSGIGDRDPGRRRRGLRRRAVLAGLVLTLAAAPAVGHALRDASLAAPADVTARGSAPSATRPAQHTGDVAARWTGDTADGPQRQRSATTAVFTHRSAELEDTVRRPVRLRIDGLGVDAPVTAFGRTEDGQLDVPRDAETVAWYREGPAPGAAGSAVLAAHVDYDGQRGVFFDLGRLEAGHEVQVAFDDGTTLDFVVSHGVRYDKRRLPIEHLFTRNGEAVLTLITCGGSFDAASRSYDANVVVQARPLDGAAPRDGATVRGR